MDTREPGVDRRRFPRQNQINAIAKVRNGSTVTEHRVRDLSAGGALLCDCDGIEGDQVYEVVLDVEGSAPIEVAATVVRFADDGALAVEFVHETDRTEDAIQSAVLQQLERRANVRVHP